uniref:Bifunctional inhibitor/plant lipid transfer protein/seed storage helical domain-containing protein n=1 Tax=Setaria italica TaxID=4555 RepID=K3ZLC4_SETIT
MASSSKLPLLFLLLVAAAVQLAPPAQAAPQVYCGDSLSGLMECRSFMFGGAAAPSPACCAAYEATFDATPSASATSPTALQGLVLPPYAPEGTRAQPPATAAAAPTALPAPSGSSEAPPSFTSPPPPAPTSKADPSEDAFLLLVATAILWALL